MRSFGPEMKSDSFYTGDSYMMSIISHSYVQAPLLYSGDSLIDQIL